ncbi:hypothetical protein P872_20700 [Rhodonellum psychrophilum GCM71 = DSM 17998]|uniref:Uncharacterized protein n=2 Tax=Rhodonellum TaxID=336827 RepID=U5BTB1_9BACT|nr:hypothetical protein P872_20700 [Rhodonellum psychrophilum GCM71 = DSM 17998]SDZ51301.1 hypothetical protein SAMN05444412_11921 [Rhodonellum ikkaensis]
MSIRFAIPLPDASGSFISFAPLKKSGATPFIHHLPAPHDNCSLLAPYQGKQYSTSINFISPKTLLKISPFPISGIIFSLDFLTKP